MSIVSEWLEDLRKTYLDDSLVLDARVGVFYTAVQISSGHVGVAFTPRDLEDTVCCPKTAAGAPPAGRLLGEKAWTLAEYALSPSGLRRALGVATLNAISAAAIDRYGLPEGELQSGLDALEAVPIIPGDKVVMVGAFIPFIKALKTQEIEVRIIDKHPNALKEDERPLWIRPEMARDELSGANVVIITGSSLVEGGLDDLLQWSTVARSRVLAGPTTPLWARPFFKHGVTALGGIRVLKPVDLLTIVGQGGSGYMFTAAAEKVCVIQRDSGAVSKQHEAQSAP